MQEIYQQEIAQSIVSSVAIMEVNGEREFSNQSFYQLGSYLGRATLGHLYEARKYRGASSDHLGSIVVLNQIQGREQERLAQLIYQNELRAQGILNQAKCNSFVKCLNFWKHNYRYYIVSQQSEYGNLRDLCQYLKANSKQLNNRQAAYFFREILKAVQQIHGCGIIHQNIKPQNIEIGSEFTIKIKDFGLSKTQSGQNNIKVGGTASMMAPELLDQSEKCSYKTDGWSVGVCLYYLLHLQLPFVGKDISQIKSNIIKNSTKGRAVKKYNDLDQIITSLIKLNPKDRKNIGDTLQNPIFQTIINEKEIKSQFLQLLTSYIQPKETKYEWKRQIDNKKFQLSNNIKQLFFSNHHEKVGIQHYIHLKQYGFFILLTNLNVIGCFNNGITLRKSLIKLSPVSNEEKVLLWIYKHYFSQIVKQNKSTAQFKVFQQPRCSIKKIVKFNQNTIVRLTNNTIYLFFGVEQTKSKYLHSNIEKDNHVASICINYHQQYPANIRIKERNKQQFVYNNTDQALNSKHKASVRYLQQILGLILLNSIVSQDRLQ